MSKSNEYGAVANCILTIQDELTDLRRYVAEKNVTDAELSEIGRFVEVMQDKLDALLFGVVPKEMHVRENTPLASRVTERLAQAKEQLKA